MFPQLDGVVVEQVTGDRRVVRVRARTRKVAVACPGCRRLTRRVHGYHLRRLADVPVSGRSVVVELRVRRLTCRTRGCPRQTFREQVPPVAARYARRTPALAALIVDIAVVLAGRAGAAMLARPAVSVSRTTVLRLLMEVSPKVGPVPVAPETRHHSSRSSHRRARRGESRTSGSGWGPPEKDPPHGGHLAGGPPAPWHNLASAVEKTVVAHSRCWHEGPPRSTGVLAERTRHKHAAVHALLAEGLGLGACARRLGWGMNTVKRYARAASAEELLRPPQYRPTLFDPYRDHLRRRLAEQPAVPITHLLAQIRDLGYPGSANLLVRYLNQGRADPERTPPSPRRLVSWLMTRPEDLPDHRTRHLDDLVAACPHLTVLAARIREFAAILTQRRGQDLDTWITAVRSDDLPALHSFAHGLEMDEQAVVAGLTLPYSNGPTEGTNTKIKLPKRQMYGRASFRLLRQRILPS